MITHLDIWLWTSLHAHIEI